MTSEIPVLVSEELKQCEARHSVVCAYIWDSFAGAGTCRILGRDDLPALFYSQSNHERVGVWHGLLLVDQGWKRLQYPLDTVNLVTV